MEPYVGAIIKTEPNTKAPPCPRANFYCEHPEPPQGNTIWKKKPVPYNNWFVAVHGFLTDVIIKDDDTNEIEFFKVIVDSIEFLGGEPSIANTSIVANKLDAALPSPRSKGFGKMKGKAPATPLKHE
ncbi:hypothetical protein JR316_0011960 [Psilocybe cubensis]|uniref:Uncharacterized protein n=2 Tax=Psilocybe cubensis TaxID=181762 RepID=A0A8H7XP01_PSICU|nr:hypothetical protein JR316_0011960 [Psilocybe cubensis]KAH9476385.1 hypothetical protein JR316_0011960 [Psilocybe cubensis]